LDLRLYLREALHVIPEVWGRIGAGLGLPKKSNDFNDLGPWDSGQSSAQPLSNEVFLRLVWLNLTLFLVSAVSCSSVCKHYTTFWARSQPKSARKLIFFLAWAFAHRERSYIITYFGEEVNQNLRFILPAWQIFEGNARDLFAFYQNKLLAILAKFAIMYILLIITQRAICK